jgi:hypothetical protein
LVTPLAVEELFADDGSVLWDCDPEIWLLRGHLDEGEVEAAIEAVELRRAPRSVPVRPISRASKHTWTLFVRSDEEFDDPVVVGWLHDAWPCYAAAEEYWYWRSVMQPGVPGALAVTWVLTYDPEFARDYSDPDVLGECLDQLRKGGWFDDAVSVAGPATCGTLPLWGGGVMGLPEQVVRG